MDTIQIVLWRLFTCAISCYSITIVTRFAALTAKASGIEQASEASPCELVTVANVRWVGVVITKTRLTTATWDERVAKVTVIAYFALISSVAHL